MGGWKVVCLLSGGPWSHDLRDCLDLYKGSQGLWEIQIPTVSTMGTVSLRLVALQLPGRCLPAQGG